MSLVNDMLKDLDRRQAPGQPTSGGGFLGTATLPGRRGGVTRPWVIGLW